jgi:acetyl esterase
MVGNRKDPRKTMPNLSHYMAVKGPIALTKLPKPVKRKLAGDPMIIDNQELDLNFQVLLKLFNRERNFASETYEGIRSAWHDLSLIERRIPIDWVENITIATSTGPIGARYYIPSSATMPGPLLVYFHGGGFVAGDLDTHDNLCRFFANNANLSVLSIDYRLAPENPFPAAVEDAISAYSFAIDCASSLGADPNRIAIGGDSAGGNLAAVVAQLAQNEDSPSPALQLLIYPVVDDTTTDNTPPDNSMQLFDGIVIGGESGRWFLAQYLKDEKHLTDTRFAPALTEDLTGLPEAHIVTAGFDPLRDEAESYAARLQSAGVKVSLKRYPSFVHGFANMLFLEECRTAVRQTALAVGQALHTH